MNVLQPGVVSYQAGYGLQEEIAADVRAGSRPTLILLEHPPTYTLGVRGDPAHILSSENRLHLLGAEVVRTDRGGDVTFHGPGQIVGYSILNLRALGIGVSDYVHGLEAMLINTLAYFGIAGVCSPRNPGVWVDDAKIAAIGVRVSRGVTTHGFALNVTTDLAWFGHIVPCGLPDSRVTSMENLTGRVFAIADVQDEIISAFARQFALDPSLAEVAV